MTEHEPTPAPPEAEASAAGDETPPADVDALREELEQTRAQFQRAVADYQNLERRSREGRLEAGRLALGGLVSGFLPVLDDLERALEVAPAESADAAWVEGVRLVTQKFTSLLEQHGVREIHALGQAFDPTKHEAAGAAPGPEGQVVHLLRRGYTLQDHVIRPAMVMVGSGEGTASEAAEGSAGEPASTPPAEEPLQE